MTNKKNEQHCASKPDSDKLVFWQLTMILNDGTIVEEKAGMNMEPEFDYVNKSVRWIDLNGAICIQDNVKAFSRSLKTDDTGTDSAEDCEEAPNCSKCGLNK